MDCSIQSELAWRDAAFIIGVAWACSVGLIVLFASRLRKALSPTRAERYLAIGFVLCTGMAPAMIWGSFDVVHCLPYRSYHSSLLLVCIIGPALAWLYVLNWLGRLVAVPCVVALFLLFESSLESHAGIAVPALLMASSLAWWHVMPLLKEESDDFSGDRN